MIVILGSFRRDPFDDRGLFEDWRVTILGLLAILESWSWTILRSCAVAIMTSRSGFQGCSILSWIYIFNSWLDQFIRRCDWWIGRSLLYLIGYLNKTRVYRLNSIQSTDFTLFLSTFWLANEFHWSTRELLLVDEFESCDWSIISWINLIWQRVLLFDSKLTRQLYQPILCRNLFEIQNKPQNFI